MLYAAQTVNTIVRVSFTAAFGNAQQNVRHKSSIKFLYFTA